MKGYIKDQTFRSSFSPSSSSLHSSLFTLHPLNSHSLSHQDAQRNSFLLSPSSSSLECRSTRQWSSDQTLVRVSAKKQSPRRWNVGSPVDTLSLADSTPTMQYPVVQVMPSYARLPMLWPLKVMSLRVSLQSRSEEPILTTFELTLPFATFFSLNRIPISPARLWIPSHLS